MGVCAVCLIRTGKKSKKSFHRIPLKRNPLIAEKWVKWIRQVKGSSWVPSNCTKMCSDHFEASAFDKSSFRVELNVNSVPSIFKPDNKAVSECGETSKENLSGPSIPNSTSLPIPETPAPEVQAVKRKSQPEIHTPSKYCRDNTPSSSTDALKLYESTTESRSVQSNLDVTPKKTTYVAVKYDTGRQRSQLFHDHNYENSPTTCRRKNIKLRKNLKKVQLINKIQKSTIKRLRKRVESLKDLVGTLRKEGRVCTEGLQCLDSFSDAPKELCMRMIKNKTNEKLTREKYPPELRCFALTLHFYSPKAYDYVRRTFNLALPHPTVLRKWYSPVNAEPGFISESFEALENRVQLEKEKKNQVICSLMLDEMGIKKGTQRGRDGKQRGHVDMGTGVVPGDYLSEANDALVLMVVGVNASWKLPIGYFLINGIDAETQANLVTESLVRLKKIGVRVTSLTLDGPPSHLATLKLLGARIDDLPNPQPYFFHPNDPSEKIYVLLDACHMLKLARNCLGEYKVLIDGEGRRIEWRYIVELAKLQDDEGLRAGNKLRSSHVNFKKNIMKVRLAAQTLSSSVADAIEFCDQELHLPQFDNSGGTVRFLRCIDCVFDFLNVRNPLGKGFKAPLRTSNEEVWHPRMQKELRYMLQLSTLDGKPIYKSRRATGFIGLYSGILAVFGIFDDFVKSEEAQLKYLLTYKLSQDHLELFFCAVRQRSGWCPNPTVSQFISAFKRLLIRHEIASTGGNVEEMDNTKILHVSSGEKEARLDRYDTSIYEAVENTRLYQQYDLGMDGNNSVNDMREFIDFAWSLPENTSEFSEHVVGYIAGFIVRKLQKNIKCSTCISSCIGESGSSAQNRLNRTSLTVLKSRGGLIIPSTSVIKICLITEKLFRHACNVNIGRPPIEKNFPAVLSNSVFYKVTQDNTIFVDLDDHSFDTAPEDLTNHVHVLIKAVIKAYTELRMYSQTKIHSLTTTGTNLRHFMTRQLVWAHQ